MFALDRSSGGDKFDFDTLKINVKKFTLPGHFLDSCCDHPGGRGGGFLEDILFSERDRT